MSKKLGAVFYSKPCVDLAKALIGKKLVRVHDGVRLAGIIVETEAYTGADDPSAHSYKGKTERNTAMFMDPGTSYVYYIYGSYCCMNISSQGSGAAVLLRSLEPVEGLEAMESKRPGAKRKKNKDGELVINTKELCNGPSKLCQALVIDKTTFDREDLINNDTLFVEDNEPIDDKDIVVTTRIGIEGSGEEAANMPLRFFLADNVCVSKQISPLKFKKRKNTSSDKKGTPKKRAKAK